MYQTRTELGNPTPLQHYKNHPFRTRGDLTASAQGYVLLQLVKTDAALPSTSSPYPGATAILMVPILIEINH